MSQILKWKRRRNMTSFQIIIFSFFALIMLGTFLLMLPISSNKHTITPFADALFTATSATCVTGLIVKDTATYWSLFGQGVIITLIQIGGMGVITIGLAVMRASGMKIGLWYRSTMQESVSAPHVGGMVRYTSFIIKTTVIIELIGAALLFPVFCSDFGVAKGIWYSLFHSISAFCNAGFDLMGIRGQFSSLTSYGSHIYLNCVIMLLIIAGGIGFLVWGDFKTHKYHFKRYSLQTKIVLLTTLMLIVLPALYFFFCEYSHMNLSDRIISSFFQSVTTRTAGFNSQDLTERIGHIRYDNSDDYRRLSGFNRGRYENRDLCGTVPVGNHGIRQKKGCAKLQKKNSGRHGKKRGCGIVYVSCAGFCKLRNNQQYGTSAVFDHPL